MDIKSLLELPQGWGIIEGQMDRWRRAHTPHVEWAKIGKMCVEFVEGNQWADDERQVLKEERRPCLQKNKIAPLARLLYGIFRQNRYDIKYLPGNDGMGIDDIADVLTGVCKQIDEINQSKWNDAQVFQDGIQCSRGYLDTRLDFDRNRMGEVIERVKDPFTIYIDPDANSYDPNDHVNGWGYFIENRWISPSDILKMFGKDAYEMINTQGNSFPVSQGYHAEVLDEVTPDRDFGLGQMYNDKTLDYLQYAPDDHINRNRKLIRVLDCQHRILKNVDYFVDLESGQEKIIPDDWPRERVQAVLRYLEAKQVPINIASGMRYRVRWTITAADRVLYDKWSPYDHMTLTPYFPYFRRGKTRGIVEDLLDPQREINRRASAMLHIIMSTANSGWIYEDGSLTEDMEATLEEEGARPGINIKYAQGSQAPQRIQPAAPPTSFKMLEDVATNDLKEIAGINDSALGQLDRVQSGKAIQARQKQSFIGAETYFDNFSRSRELKARIRLNLIQNFYTEPRIVRVRGGELGDDQEIRYNYVDAAGSIINNISVGTYDIAIDEVPISSTFQQSQFEEGMELLKEGVPIPPDILVDLSSMPAKQSIKERMRDERQWNEMMQRGEALGMRMQMGIPPDMPIPPAPIDNLGRTAPATPDAGMPPMGGQGLSTPDAPPPPQQMMLPLPPPMQQQPRMPLPQQRPVQ